MMMIKINWWFNRLIINVWKKIWFIFHCDLMISLKKILLNHFRIDRCLATSGYFTSVIYDLLLRHCRALNFRFPSFNFRLIPDSIPSNLMQLEIRKDWFFFLKKTPIAHHLRPLPVTSTYFRFRIEFQSIQFGRHSCNYLIQPAITCSLSLPVNYFRSLLPLWKWNDNQIKD